MKLLIDFILVIGILASFAIIFLLYKSKKRALPQNILIVFFVFILFYIVNSYADLHGLPILYVLSFSISDILVWVVGPTLYLYIKSLFNKSEGLLLRHKYHFIPALIYFVAISIPILFHIFDNNKFYDYLWFVRTDDYLLPLLEDIYLLAYLLLSLKLFKDYRSAMKLNYSDLNEDDFGWIKNLLLGSISVIVIDILLISYNFFFGDFYWAVDYITAIAIIVVVSYLGYHGVNQSKVLLPHFLIKENFSEEKEKLHHLSNASEKELEELKTRFERVLKNEKPYLDEDLTLSKLAKLIPTTDKKLSALLNQHLDTTFYDIINTYRVEAVKEKLRSDDFDNYTLLGIAYECGFKSKTSFNRSFKNETGLSPSEFKKNAIL